MEPEEGAIQPTSQIIEIHESVLEESRSTGSNYSGEKEEGEVLATEHGNESYDSGFGNVFLLERSFYVQDLRPGQ